MALLRVKFWIAVEAVQKLADDGRIKKRCAVFQAQRRHFTQRIVVVDVLVLAVQVGRFKVEFVDHGFFVRQDETFTREW